MTQPSIKTGPNIMGQSSAMPEVIVNRNAFISGGATYLMRDIKNVEIKHMPWQYWASGVSMLPVIYLYTLPPDILVVAG